MNKLLFEKVGDIHSAYPYLYVYLYGDCEPFMGIAVTDSRELEFTVFKHENRVVLTAQQLQEVLERAISFLPQALENEDNSGMA